MSGPRLIGIPAIHARSYAGLEALAKYLRKTLRFGKDQPLPGVELFENLDRITVASSGRKIRLEYAVNMLEQGVEAVTRYCPDRGCIEVVLSESCYEGLEQRQVRARFSLCHELSHAVLHVDELIQLANTVKLCS